MNRTGLRAAAAALDKESDTDCSGAIFKKIARDRRVNYYELENVYRNIVRKENLERDEIKIEIRKTLDILKQRKWIGELTLPNDELNVFYLTAEGSLAADDDY
jgi:hypothetical protein